MSLRPDPAGDRAGVYSETQERVMIEPQRCETTRNTS